MKIKNLKGVLFWVAIYAKLNRIKNENVILGIICFLTDYEEDSIHSFDLHSLHYPECSISTIVLPL